MIQSVFLSTKGTLISTYYDTDPTKGFVWGETENKDFHTLKPKGNVFLVALLKGEITLTLPNVMNFTNGKATGADLKAGMKEFSIKDKDFFKISPKFDLENPEFIDKESV